MPSYLSVNGQYYAARSNEASKLMEDWQWEHCCAERDKRHALVDCPPYAPKVCSMIGTAATLAACYFGNFWAAAGIGFYTAVIFMKSIRISDEEVDRQKVIGLLKREGLIGFQPLKTEPTGQICLSVDPAELDY